jgi:CheY-like chemotaxis protein
MLMALMMAMKLNPDSVLGLSGIGPKAMQAIEAALASVSFPEPVVEKVEEPIEVPVEIPAISEVESAVEAMKLGAVDFLQKPFDPEEIRELVSRVMDRDLLDEHKAVDYTIHIELAKNALEIGISMQPPSTYVRRSLSIQGGPRPSIFWEL